jgi:hypothetical protein
MFHRLSDATASAMLCPEEEEPVEVEHDAQGDERDGQVLVPLVAHAVDDRAHDHHGHQLAVLDEEHQREADVLQGEVCGGNGRRGG